MQVYLHVYYTLQYKHYITALQVHDVEIDVMCLLDVTDV